MNDPKFFLSEQIDTSSLAAMKWEALPTEYGLLVSANKIIAWVIAEGGDARYVPHGEDTKFGWSGYPRIAVRSHLGWDYASPGWYIIKGDDFFQVPAGVFLNLATRNFYVRKEIR